MGGCNGRGLAASSPTFVEVEGTLKTSFTSSLPSSSKLSMVPSSSPYSSSPRASSSKRSSAVAAALAVKDDSPVQRFARPLEHGMGEARLLRGLAIFEDWAERFQVSVCMEIKSKLHHTGRSWQSTTDPIEYSFVT